MAEVQGLKQGNNQKKWQWLPQLSLSRWETQSESCKDNYRNDIILSVRAWKAPVLAGRSRSESPEDHFAAFLMLRGTGSVRNPYPEVVVGAAWKAIFSVAGKALLRLCSFSLSQKIITAHSSCSSSIHPGPWHSAPLASQWPQGPSLWLSVQAVAMWSSKEPSKATPGQHLGQENSLPCPLICKD